MWIRFPTQQLFLGSFPSLASVLCRSAAKTKVKAYDSGLPILLPMVLSQIRWRKKERIIFLRNKLLHEKTVFNSKKKKTHKMRKFLSTPVFLTHSEIPWRLEVSGPQRFTAQLRGGRGFCEKGIAAEMLWRCLILTHRSDICVEDPFWSSIANQSILV